MLAGELEAFPMACIELPPDLTGELDFFVHGLCAAGVYWAQRARDLAPEALATAAMTTVVGAGFGVYWRATTAQLVGAGVEGWLRRLAGMRDPERLHWALADRVLKGEPDAGVARVRDSLGRALCDALRELAAAVLPAFLVPDLELEEAAAGAADVCLRWLPAFLVPGRELEETAARAAAAALAWLEPRAVPEHTAELAKRFSERLEAYRAAVVGPIALADRVPLLAGVGSPSPPDGGWWVAPGGSNLLGRAVWREADRTPPVQPGEPALDERWGAPGGVDLWLQWLPRCSQGRDSLIVRIVADVALARVRAEVAEKPTRRKAALHRGVVEGIMLAAGAGAVCEGGRIMAPLVPGGRKLSAVPLVAGAVDWVVGGNDAAVLALQLASWLAYDAHRQMEAGMPDPDRVVLPAGRDAFSTATGGISASRGEIEAALEWLRCVRVAGEGLVYAWDATREPSPAGGRPTELLVVRVGEMLWPWRGLEWWERHPSLEIPSRLRWLSPVLPVADAPIVGNHQTRGLQRSVWSLGLGAVLVDRREEYAERGGVEWATLKAGVQRLGLWERSHNSLAERWLVHACEQPAQLELVRTAAPLERFERDRRTLVRLGPDYADAEDLVLGAAGRTKAARAAQKRGASKRRR